MSVCVWSCFQCASLKCVFGCPRHQTTSTAAVGSTFVLYSTGFRFQTNIVDYYVLWSALLHIFANLKRLKNQKLSSVLRVVGFLTQWVFRQLWRNTLWNVTRATTTTLSRKRRCWYTLCSVLSLSSSSISLNKESQFLRVTAYVTEMSEFAILVHKYFGYHHSHS